MRAWRLLIAVALATAALSSPVLADQSQHTTQLPLSLTAAGAAAGQPALRSGHVVNIHTQGPVNFAIEEYQVNGAQPTTNYAVVLGLFASSCAGAFLFPFPNGAVLTTDGHGDAHGQNKISPAQVAQLGLHNKDFGIVWTLVASGVAAYATPCTNVHID